MPAGCRVQSAMGAGDEDRHHFQITGSGTEATTAGRDCSGAITHISPCRQDQKASRISCLKDRLF
ncbi:hypothetical protein NC652_023489 [Populus alba x Populus x berolinensis]|uniref:Uncharacterized protein n=1 Tax=Populus alba x Populus x berolinensis TaxID=444605 RepID=A0AAD6QAE6_9ROSI|nr:hypothetical protein NC652_023489 [Populus alba x Populus x berolinensis]KAJ6985164.1 hypothetical protein NC653_023213 [Populus alba x Populus x berolinensis]